MRCVECGNTMSEQEAAAYHYLEGGLDDVFLSGLTIYKCAKCGEEMVEIPNLKQLHLAIGLSLVEKSTRLTGNEIRFIRKELGLLGKEFARFIGCTPEALSRIETKNHRFSPPVDRLIRLLFFTKKQSEIELYRKMQSRAPARLYESTKEFFKEFEIGKGESQEPIRINMADLIIHSNQKSDQHVM